MDSKNIILTYQIPQILSRSRSKAINLSNGAYIILYPLTGYWRFNAIN